MVGCESLVRKTPETLTLTDSFAKQSVKKPLVGDQTATVAIFTDMV